jgi:hypothetical protein
MELVGGALVAGALVAGALVAGALVAGALVAGALVASDNPSSVLLHPASATSAAVAVRAILRRIVVLLNSASDTLVIACKKARPLAPVKAVAMPGTSVRENRHEPVGKSLHEVSADLLGMTHLPLQRGPERIDTTRLRGRCRKRGPVDRGSTEASTGA